MSHEELRDQYELYAMGALEDPARAEIREHLERGCEVCAAEAGKARRVVALLGASAPAADPPARLRGRILASVGVAEPKPVAWAGLAWAAFALLCLAAAVYFGGRQGDYARQMARMREEMRRQNIEITRLNEAFAILNGAGTREAAFGADRQAPPRGKVYVNPAAGVLLIVANLPPAAPGRIYEMWVIPRSGNPAPAGLFQSGADGNAVHVRRGPVDLAAAGAVAVTVESEGGAAQPTSTPVIVAPLSGE